MRRRGRRRGGFHEPSLVPLADMLTNTVGVMVFIMIFTVLTAGGVVVVKRLPLEREVQLSAIHFICRGGRIFAIDPALMKKFNDSFDSGPKSYAAVEGWVKKFNQVKLEDEEVSLHGEGDVSYSSDGFTKTARMSLLLVVAPRDGRGDDLTSLAREDSPFQQVLRRNSPKERFANFSVYPDSLDIFSKAREVAVGHLNYDYGWFPMEAEKPLRFNLTGGGYAPHVQ